MYCIGAPKMLCEIQSPKSIKHIRDSGSKVTIGNILKTVLPEYFLSQGNNVIFY